MELRSKGQGLIRRPPVPNGPTVEILFGGDGPDVGLLRIEVPPGAGMPEHDHGGSDIVLHTLEGSVVISKGDESIQVDVGDSAFIEKTEKVALRNPDEQRTAVVLVAAGPPVFVSAIRNWPA